MSLYDGKAITDKPKLSPIKAINKFLIYAGIKLDNYDEQIRIYYAWGKTQPKWYLDEESGLAFPLERHITVDYDHSKRMWYIGYIEITGDRYFGSIDDITGRVDLVEND
jgi:hypothetical protein